MTASEEELAEGSAGTTVRVWDPVVRLCHWGLAASLLVGYLTHEGDTGIHIWSGFAALGFAVARIVWGFLSGGHARFASFVRPPDETLAYARALGSGREVRFIGHNPLGGYMILALIATTLAVTLSGWLYTTDAYWGIEWVANLHDGATNVLIALVVLHLAGVAFTSWRHRENLAASLVHGRKARRDKSTATARDA